MCFENESTRVGDKMAATALLTINNGYFMLNHLAYWYMLLYGGSAYVFFMEPYSFNMDIWNNKKFK